jgi:hypothetical protein
MRRTWKQFAIGPMIGSLLLSLAMIAPARAQEAPPAPAGTQTEGVETEGVKTLTRGPVHEAFAAPTAHDPTPSTVVERQPPEPIEEEAPDYKPEGAIWVPGYWDWDPSASNFLWVSGLWRVPPPDMRWVPPYWAEAEGGWQRVPGFWTSIEAKELSYQETPPESLEVGPSTPAPAENYFYIPGSWNYYDSGFRWRAGYWSPYRENYVWCPDRWYWTPSGCVFTAGYWDWQPNVRGQLFAPIAFTSNVYLQPGWRYRPWCVIDTGRFYSNLWIGPRAHSYFFGDYYGSWGSRWGFSPWCDWSYGSRRFYDPLWSWCNTHYGRRGIDFIGRTRGWHRYYERNERFRPARTFDEQRRLVAEGRFDRDRGQNILAASLRDVAQREDNALRLTRITDQQRESVRRLTNEIRELNTERRQVEADARVAARADRADQDRPDQDRPGQDRAAGRGRGNRLTLPQVSEEVRTAAAGRDLPARPERPGRSAADRAEADRTTRRDPDATRPGETRDPQDRVAERDRDREPGQDRTDRGRPDRSGETPRPETPRPDRPGETPETPRPETPRPETPRTPRPDATPDEGPRTPGRSDAEDRTSESPRTPRPETPRTETPRAERPERPSERPGDDAPRTPRPDAPRPDVTRPDTTRPDTPRTTRPTPGRTEAPSIERRPETPRVERPSTPAPRTTAPRTETPRAQPRPRPEASSRTAPRAQPRVQSTPQTAAPRNTAPRASSRGQSPRVSTRPSAPRSSSNSNRGRGDRD